ncbi:hypothetical protein MNBD_NITROSPINAE02-1785 [hydrothermal vent metagenome]|uniref:AlgX/AlgJ SGNH hydrolase-like domain-containing protein n=1 Tax=hydrothermal vent metagenome TaxID=652676 RepID=A0A3B1C6M4_9ZZZZ
MKPIKKISFYIFMFVLILGTAEICANIFFHYTKDRFTFHDFSDYLLDPEIIPNLKNGWDFDLGWTNTYKTEYGERPRPVIYKENLMSTFGDSFTHCDQVNHDETWQTYLSERVGENVFNFGVGGYGTGQAYLRYKRISPKIKTPIVTLALLEENLSRVANVYRKFYFPKTGGPLTKPRFTLDEKGRLKLLANPIKNPDELIKLSRQSFLDKIGKNDFWYNQKDYPIFSFPFLKIFFNKRFWLEVKYIKGDNRIDDMVARPAYLKDIWSSPEADVMFAIFDAFVKDVRDSGATPIIMIIPTKYDAVNYFTNKQNQHNIRKIIAYCKKKNYLVFDAVKGLARNAKSMDDVKSYYRGHVSPLGNKLIGQAFFEFLAQNGLAPTKKAITSR